MKFGYSLIALLVITNFASAFPLFDTPPAQRAVGNCTNFSGDFKGKCIVEGKQITKSSHIEQSGCDTFTVEGETIQVGALITRAKSAPATVETARFDWDKSMKNLLISGAAIDGSGDATALHGQMMLEGNRVTQVLTVVGTEKEYGTCVLTRQ